MNSSIHIIMIKKISAQVVRFQVWSNSSWVSECTKIVPYTSRICSMKEDLKRVEIAPEQSTTVHGIGPI